MLVCPLYYSYIYRITHIESGYHYYGGRYKKMQNRFSYDALEDLKQYQSSSSNVQWKHRIRNYPQEFKFKIVKKLPSINQGYTYESKLHYKFNVAEHPKFINKTNEEPIGKYIGYIIYDLLYDIAIHIKDIDTFNIINENLNRNLHKLCKISSTVDYYIFNNRYCVYNALTIDIIKENYNRNNEEYYVYKYDKKSGMINEILVTDITTYNIVGINLRGTKSSSYKGYYLDKSLCEHFNNLITLYYKDIQDSIQNINLYYHELSAIDDEIYSNLIGKNRETHKGYSKSPNTCSYIIDNYKKPTIIDNIIVLYSFDILLDKLTEHKFTYNELFKILYKKTRKIWDGKMHSSLGYYIDKDKCLFDYKKIKLYYMNIINVVEEIEIYRCDMTKIHPELYSKLITDGRRCAYGYSLYYEHCSYYQKSHNTPTFIDNKIVLYTLDANSNIIKLLYTYPELLKVVPKASELWNGKRRSCNGYYIYKDEVRKS